MKLNIAISARHVHLNEEDFIYLFGKEKKLTKYKDIGQPGQFAAEEKVNIITEKSRFDNVRIVGPIRKYTQVEISKTDSYILGINPPVRDSGDLENSEKIIIEYREKQLLKENCCIIANRHIHIKNSDLNKYNLKNGQTVKLKVYGEKGAILENVKIKASDDALLEAHLDLDDANANIIDTNVLGEVIYE